MRITNLILLTILALNFLNGQKKIEKLESYTASNGITYNEGDEIQLGKGSGDDGTFTYITVAGITQNTNDTSKNRLRASAAGGIGKIKRIREYNYRSMQGVHFYIGTGGPSNYMVNVEMAIESCEVTPCRKDEQTVGQPDKYEQLRKIKKLLDEGVLTQEEYESEKKKLLGN